MVMPLPVYRIHISPSLLGQKMAMQVVGRVSPLPVVFKMLSKILLIHLPFSFACQARLHRRVQLPLSFGCGGSGAAREPLAWQFFLEKTLSLDLDLVNNPLLAWHRLAFFALASSLHLRARYTRATPRLCRPKIEETKNGFPAVQTLFRR